jgi:hypothetical protein
MESSTVFWACRECREKNNKTKIEMTLNPRLIDNIAAAIY